jgi:hypothetical protein
MNIEIELRVVDFEIRVKAKLLNIHSTANEIHFVLNHLLNIRAVCSNDSPVVYSTKEAEVLFRRAQEIIIENNHYDEITIEYGGKVDGYHTIINDQICAINFYSCWYPDGFNVPVNSLNVKFYTDHYNRLINGSHNSAEKCYEYVPLDFDCNILALRDGNVLSYRNIDVYYFDIRNEDIAKRYAEEFNNSLEYCAGLFGSTKIEKMNLCILPEGNKYDGYMRKKLIVLGGFNEDTKGFIHLITHETAHTWCTGADASSWEDWLNETTAEWTALVYDLDNNNNDLFDTSIQEREGRSKNYPPIKTADGHRPDGVHDKGTLLFYSIYKIYGIGMIKKLLTAYNALGEKNTENYLKMIYEIEPEVSRLIKEGILR